MLRYIILSTRSCKLKICIKKKKIKKIKSFNETIVRFFLRILRNTWNIKIQYKIIPGIIIYFNLGKNLNWNKNVPWFFNITNTIINILIVIQNTFYHRSSSLYFPPIPKALSAGKGARKAHYEAQYTAVIGVLAAYGETALVLGQQQPPTMVHAVGPCTCLYVSQHAAPSVWACRLYVQYNRISEGRRHFWNVREPWDLWRTSWR